MPAWTGKIMQAFYLKKRNYSSLNYGDDPGKDKRCGARHIRKNISIFEKTNARL